MKKRNPLIFSENFFREADKAVERAVESSKAAGLPKAYLDSYEQLNQTQPTIEKRVVNGR